MGAAPGDKGSVDRPSGGDPAVTPEGPFGDSAPRIVETRRTSVSASYSGPLPLPSFLQAYENVLPGSAERILQIAEQQSAHRRDVVASLVAAEVFRSRWGLWLGAAVAAAFLIAATVMVLAGHPWPGTIVGAADIAGVVGVFVYGTWFRGRELRSRTQDEDRAPPP